MFFKEENIELRDNFTTYTKLMDAIVYSGVGGDPDIKKIECLLNMGANPNAGLGDSNLIVFHQPLDKGASCLILLMCRSKAFNSFSQNLQNIADLLLSHGAEVNAITAKGNTALHYAAKLGLINWVKYLIDKKANSTVKNNMGIEPIALTDDNDIYDILDNVIDDNFISQALS